MTYNRAAERVSVMKAIVEEEIVVSGYVQISRDPFARETVVREIVHTTTETCGWCGNNHHNHLFRYGVEPDSISCRVNWSKGIFCSVDCWRTYNSM